MYQRAGSELQDASLSLGGYYRADTWEAIGYQQKFKDNLMLMADLEGSLMQVKMKHYFIREVSLFCTVIDYHKFQHIYLYTSFCQMSAL